MYSLHSLFFVCPFFIYKIRIYFRYFAIFLFQSPLLYVLLQEADHISALSAGYLALPLRALEGDWKDQEGRRNRLHPICFQFLRASLPQILFTEVVAATGLFCSNN
jgi:hypothetical protein